MKTVKEQLEELELKVNKAIENYKRKNKDEEIRLQLTLAYLNFTKNDLLLPLQEPTDIVEKFYQYVKEGQKPKKPIQDEI